MILIEFSTEHCKCLPLEEHGFLVDIGKQLQRATLHAYDSQNQVWGSYNCPFSCICHVIKMRVLTDEVFKHGLLVSQ